MTPIPAVLVRLLLEGNTYLLFNSDIVNFVWKTVKGGGERESIVLLIFVIWRCFNRRWVSGCGLGQKLPFRASWNRIFSSRDLSWRNKHDSFWLVVSTGYFYILWAIVFQIFFPSKFIKIWYLPLYSITISVNIFVSHIIQHEIIFLCIVLFIVLSYYIFLCK